MHFATNFAIRLLRVSSRLALMTQCASRRRYPVGCASKNAHAFFFDLKATSVGASEGVRLP